MRGQISLELLIVFLIFLSLFFIIVPNIEEVKEVGDYALNLRNAELILDKIYYACERVYLRGPNSEENLVLYLLTDYFITGDKSLTITFKNNTKEISRDLDFPCIADFNISKGRSEIIIFYEDNRALVIPNSKSSL